MKLINGFASGKEPLWKAFLILGLLANFIVGFTIALFVQITPDNPLLLQLVVAIGLLIAIFAWIGQWRCAFNTKYFFLGALLRTWLILGALAAIGNLLPILPTWARSAVGILLAGLFLFAIIYYFITPVRDYVRLQIYKYKNPDK